MELAERHQDHEHQVPDARDWIEVHAGTDVRAGFDSDGDSRQDYARNQVELVRECELRLVHSALRSPKRVVATLHYKVICDKPEMMLCSLILVA
jgi:hypothetical protein